MSSNPENNGVPVPEIPADDEIVQIVIRVNARTSEVVDVQRPQEVTWHAVVSHMIASLGFVRRVEEGIISELYIVAQAHAQAAQAAEAAQGMSAKKRRQLWVPPRARAGRGAP